MAFVVVYDANVLYPSTLRDVLIRVATGGWSRYRRLIDTVELPDPGDRHVVAAAIRARAQLIVTFNLKHFPAGELAAWNIEAKHPDDFLIDQFHLDAINVHQAVQAVADSWSKPPGTLDDVLDRLDRSGLPQTAAVLRR